MTIVDLHCHLLPGVDDGPKNMAQSLDLARLAVSEGITYSLVTPHHMNGHYLNPRGSVIAKTQAFQTELTANQIPLTVFPGQEVHLTGELLKALDQKDILFADSGNHYLMLELPEDSVPEYTWDMLDELLARQIVPVIVHPERNAGLQEAPNLLYKMIQLGCLSQLTANSYIGGFGKTVEKISAQFVEAGLCQILASDAHNTLGRSFKMASAFKKLSRHSRAAAGRFQKRAVQILNGEPTAPFQFREVTTRKRFFLF